MIEAIAELIEFDTDLFENQQIMEDFNHKFHGSWIEVNGIPHKLEQVEIHDGDNYRIILHTTDLKQNEKVFDHDDVISLKRITPQTGLYLSDWGLVYLSRLPHRQWIKSFFPGQNYQVHVLQRSPNKPVAPNARNTVLNPKAAFHKESMIYQNAVWLHWRKVGTVKDDMIKLASNKFQKEIKELWPQYLITLDAKPQPALQVANLITDF